MKPFSAISVLTLLLAFCAASATAQETPGSKEKRVVSYAKDVAPILDKFCAGCHNADEEHPSQLYLESYELLMKGGKHGASVKPGSAEGSLLVQKMGKEPPFGKVMPPPKKKTPTPEQVQIIRAWIDEGAKKN